MGDKDKQSKLSLETVAGLIAKINELQVDIDKHCENEQRFRDIAENTPGRGKGFKLPQCGIDFLNIFCNLMDQSRQVLILFS